MASVKLGTLVIRTIAKPIAEQLKNYARSNQRFRGFCISLAQNLWRAEIRLRESLLGEVHGTVRPLNDAKAIQNGSNFLAEGFLFSVGAGLIIAETWRSSRSQSKRRDDVDDRIEEMEGRLNRLMGMLEALGEHVESVGTDVRAEAARNEELSRVLVRVVDIGLRGGWAEFEDHPIQLPHLQLDHFKPRTSTSGAGLETPAARTNALAIPDHTDKSKSSLESERMMATVTDQLDLVDKSARR